MAIPTCSSSFNQYDPFGRVGQGLAGYDLVTRLFQRDYENRNKGVEGCQRSGLTLQGCHDLVTLGAESMTPYMRLIYRVDDLVSSRRFFSRRTR